MARFVATDFNITINGDDLSNAIAAVTIDQTADEVETTSFGGSGFRSRVAGLQDASITIDFHHDYASGAVSDVLYSLVGSQATVVVKPTSGTVSASNPSFTGVFLCTEWQTVSGSVGDLATASVTWPLAAGSGIVRATS